MWRGTQQRGMSTLLWKVHTRTHTHRRRTHTHIDEGNPQFIDNKSPECLFSTPRGCEPHKQIPHISLVQMECVGTTAKIWPCTHKHTHPTHMHTLVYIRHNTTLTRTHWHPHNQERITFHRNYVFKLIDPCHLKALL